MTEPRNREAVFKLVDYLTKRLDDTLSHTQVSTRNIYLVNGAILAAIYFAFGQEPLPDSAFWAAAALSFLLAAVNWIHANFLSDQNDWYRTLDAEVQRLFESISEEKTLWPERLDEVRRRVAPPRKGPLRVVFPRFLYRSQWTYVAIHLVITVALVAAGVTFTIAAIR